MTPRVQNLLVILGIVLIAALGYYLYTQNAATTLVVGTVDNQVAVETGMFLERLNALKEVSFDTSIFTDPRFSALVDFSQPVTSQPVWRQNPFVTN